ncbi:MAG TPA: tetratricopeptide repeat protein [Bryobacteraceae bacterium]|jgi:tetratricopeptide (TPR) repeat protein
MWAVLLTVFAVSGAQAFDLPRIDTASFAPAIKKQIEDAEAQARAHPEDAKVVGAFGMLLHTYEQRAPAAKVYALAQRLDGRNFVWPYLLGRVEFESGQFGNAARDLEAAIRIDPASVPALLLLAQSKAALADWEQAGKLYRALVEKQPSCPQAWYGLGRVQAATGDHAAAAQSFGKACTLFPAYGAAQFAWAGELRKLHKASEAAAHLEAYSKDRDIEPPLDDPALRQVRQLNQSSTVHFERAAQLEAAGKLNEAIGEQEAILAADPNNVQAHVNLISLYARTNNAAQAKQHFERATRLDAGRADAWYNYGVLLFNQRQWDEAAEAFRHALSINPHYAEAHNNLGAVYEIESKLAQAADEFRAAIADRPDYPLARFHLARLLVNQQKYDEAEEQLTRALTPEDDNTPMYTYALAATYARAGKRDEALRYYQQAHDRATARGQSQLAANIDRELRALREQR